ncbi:hypothetical protein Ocin01_17229 [Orchesella cincta]|uniref:Uncharacterized protein n=1 Tax=Orchesella cincta TaxID=48709 RepID=A0A1D2M942_ORCCI|nr:hypothetical protein Ocin01_17229 [Orchesella cincta]
MKPILLLVFVVFPAYGIPTSAPDGTADKLEAFPWIKASKVKSRFGTTLPPPVPPTEASSIIGASRVATNSLSQPAQQQDAQTQAQPQITDEMLQNYIAALAARLQAQPESSTSPPKRLGKPKVPKQLKPQDSATPTTPAYWQMEKTEYPDSFYDEFYLDWLRKRQIETIPVATPNPLELTESADVEPPQSNNPPPTSPQTLPPPPQPFPSMPLAMNPFANPFLYPFTGLKLTKAMANAQVNAALAAWNITTTSKPVKIKLKIPIPPGDDLAQVVASGIAGFPAGTTYELSKKK